ncbi:MAG: malate dehydrogenase [Polyangiales bacterium]
MHHHRAKIALIGSGNIGGELAALCAREELGDVVLFDIPEKENFAKGKALDLEQNGAVLGYDRSIIGTSNPADLEGCDVAVVTAGVPRKPGMSRDDLVAINLKIVRAVAENLKKHAPNAFVIVITNPLDAMVYEMKKATGFPKERVVGMAGVLDSARFQLFIARAASVSTKDVRAMVLGGHGDTMVPVLSYATINGVPITQILKKEEIEKIVVRTREGGGELVKLMGTSAYYAPASAAVHMARAYLRDEKRVLPCAVYLEGEYGYRDLYMGVPAVIGAKGVEKVIEVTLTGEEKAMLDKSAAAVKELIEVSRKL